MVLNHFGVITSEEELRDHVSIDYGKSFSNIWNPTIAKLARGYSIAVVLGADWPLLKSNNLSKAMKEYEKDPKKFDVMKYENPDDKDHMPEPLSLAYRELYAAVKKGCKTEFGALTKERIKKALVKNHLIQTSVKLRLLYPGNKGSLHSILIYKIDGNKVYYHDPYKGAGLTCSFEHLLRAVTGLGAYMIY